MQAFRLLLVLWLLLSGANAEVTPHRPIRCQRDAKAQLSTMDTSITRFKHPTKGYTVDLISVVHVAPQDYYTRLNKAFRVYDAVLYELIADGSEGRPMPVVGAETSDNPLTMVQHGMSSVLGLDFQLDHVDYSPPNFVHADVSPVEFQKSMDKNKESFLQILLRSLQSGGVDSPEAERELEQVNMMNLFGKGPSPQDRVHLRRTMAIMFSKPEQMTELLEGPGGGTLLAARNQKALSILRQQVGKGKKRLAIFYGAAHMLDMEKRLIKDFGVQFTGQQWLSAWDLRMPPESK